MALSDVDSPAPEGAAAPRGRRAARAYDFSTPEVLDRNRLRSLRLVVDNFSRLASRNLSADLRCPAELEVLDMSELTWEELAQESLDATCMLLFGLDPLPGRATLHLPAELAMAIVDLRMGGDGRGTLPDRPLSDIDVELLTDTFAHALEQLVTAFAPVSTLTLGDIQVEATAQIVQVFRAADRCIAAPIELRIGESDPMVHRFHLAFPVTTLRPLVASLGQSADRRRARADDGSRRVVSDRLLEVPVELSVRFRPTWLSSGEVLGLAVGDVINLHHEQTRPLEIVVEDVPYGYARPAERGRRIACTVVEMEEESQ